MIRDDPSWNQFDQVETAYIDWLLLLHQHPNTKIFKDFLMSHQARILNTSENWRLQPARSALETRPTNNTQDTTNNPQINVKHQQQTHNKHKQQTETLKPKNTRNTNNKTQTANTRTTTTTTTTTPRTTTATKTASPTATTTTTAAATTTATTTAATTSTTATNSIKPRLLGLDFFRVLLTLGVKGARDHPWCKGWCRRSK